MSDLPHQPEIILASSSPYRRTQLQRLGISFECCTPAIDESAGGGETPTDYVARLAAAKATAIAARAQCRNTLVIGADQALVLGDEIISKPGDAAAAFTMLQRCSGRTVMFYCGWCLADGGGGILDAAVIPTEVQFRALRDDEIRRYIRREPAFDCAGAFKAEALGITLFRAIRSDDPSALIGLPLISLAGALRRQGIELP